MKSLIPLRYRHVLRGTGIAALLVTGLLLLVSSADADAGNPVPYINQPLVPDAAAPGGSGFTLTVNGTGFVSGSVVDWNGSARTTTFVNGSQLTAAIAASDIATAVTAWVTVVNPAPGGGTSSVVFFPINSPTSAIGFQRTDYSLGTFPLFMAAGDFNGDSNLDLVVANFDSNSVSVLLGKGDGTFQHRVDYATCGRPQTPIVGDFNGDGKLDVAVACVTSTILVLLGNGDGTFQAKGDFPTGSYPAYGMTADFNGDGKLDITTINQGSDSVSILLGNGDGTFQANTDYPVGFTPTGVAAADFNRDGKLDLAVSNYGSGTVSILLGNGDGTFQTQVHYATGSGPGGVNVADVNGDGKVDLLIPNQVSGTISVLLGNGNGTFSQAVDYPVSAGAVRADVGDFNQDGKLDLAVATFKPSVDILLGNGDGTFQAPSSFTTGKYPWSVVAGDFNRDGHLDVATANANDNTASVLLQTTGGELLAREPDFRASTSRDLQLTLASDAHEHRRRRVEHHQCPSVRGLLPDLHLPRHLAARGLLHDACDFHSHLGRCQIGRRLHQGHRARQPAEAAAERYGQRYGEHHLDPLAPLAQLW